MARKDSASENQDRKTWYQAGNESLVDRFRRSGGRISEGATNDRSANDACEKWPAERVRLYFVAGGHEPAARTGCENCQKDARCGGAVDYLPQGTAAYYRGRRFCGWA